MENRLEHLNQVNDVPVHSVLDPEFASYGRVVTGYDFSEMIAYMEQNTPIPENGNTYVASVPEMEALAVSAEVQKKFYGDMPIEVGYCNGRNTTWNGFEYHKGSEINVAVTDFMLILGHVWQIEDNTYRFENAKVFFVPKGTAVEMYQTTLHLSPCRVCDAASRAWSSCRGARTLRWTRRPLTATRRASCCSSETSGSLHTREREPLIKQGAYPGLLGENKELHY